MVVGGVMKLYWGLVSVESRVVGEWGQKVVWWGGRVVGVGGCVGGCDGVVGWSRTPSPLVLMPPVMNQNQVV